MQADKRKTIMQLVTKCVLITSDWYTCDTPFAVTSIELIQRHNSKQRSNLVNQVARLREDDNYLWHEQDGLRGMRGQRRRKEGKTETASLRERRVDRAGVSFLHCRICNAYSLGRAFDFENGRCLGRIRE